MKSRKQYYILEVSIPHVILTCLILGLMWKCLYSTIATHGLNHAAMGDVIHFKYRKDLIRSSFPSKIDHLDFQGPSLISTKALAPTTAITAKEPHSKKSNSMFPDAHSKPYSLQKDAVTITIFSYEESVLLPFEHED